MNLKLSIPTKLSRGAVVALCVALAVVASAAWLYWQFHADPPKPWALKWSISRYLKGQTGRSDFSIDFQFPSKAEMRTVPAGSKSNAGADSSELTKKDFETLKKEYTELLTSAMALRREATDVQKALGQRRAGLTALEKQLAEAQAASATNLAELQASAAPMRAQVAALEKDLAAKEVAAEAREKAVEPVLSELQAFQKTWATQREATELAGTNSLTVAQAELVKDMRQKLQDAGSYETMYLSIGQELWVANRLFDSANPEHLRVALAIARQAGRDALYQTENGWLAASIYKAYVCPNLNLAEGKGGQDILVNECADVFRRAGDQGGMLGIYRTMLAQAATPQRADWARLQIAQAYEQSGEFQQSIHWLKQIKSTNDFRWAIQRIPRLERQAKPGR